MNDKNIPFRGTFDQANCNYKFEIAKEFIEAGIEKGIRKVVEEESNDSYELGIIAGERNAYKHAFEILAHKFHAEGDTK